MIIYVFDSILNKITPEKFHKLSKELLGVGLDSPGILKGVILLIFDKALEEPKYSCMYAKLCRIISEEAPNFETETRSSNNNNNGPLNKVSFLMMHKMFTKCLKNNYEFLFCRLSVDFF